MNNLPTLNQVQKSTVNNCKVSVYDEWLPLEEVIVGVVENARLPEPDPSVRGVDFPELADEDIPTGK